MSNGPYCISKWAVLEDKKARFTMCCYSSSYSMAGFTLRRKIYLHYIMILMAVSPSHIMLLLRYPCSSITSSCGHSLLGKTKKAPYGAFRLQC